MAEAKLSGPMKLLQKMLKKRVPGTGIGSPKQQGLRVGALNAESIIRPERRDCLKDLIENKNFDVFAVIETHLLKTHHTGTKLNLTGYSYVRKDRRYVKKDSEQKLDIENNKPKTKGGGILIYIHESVNYKVKSRGEYAESNVEFLHIEITYPVQLHLVALYSPGMHLVDHLISLMSYFMEPLGKDRKIMFIGDTNIDKYGVERHHYLGNKFFRVLKRKYRVKQLINKVTHGNGRKEKHSGSCIDHIFTNFNVLERGVIANSVTTAKTEYHEGIYCTVRVSLRYWTWRSLWQMLQNDDCILAIFCKFRQADEMLQTKRPLFRRVKGNESVYGMTFKDVAEIDNRILQKFINKIVSNQRLLRDNEQQWTIFTRNKASILFKYLYQTMNAPLRNFTYETYPQKGVDNTTYDAQEAAGGDVQEFMNKLVPLLNISANRCILAVFYQFPSIADVPNITPDEDNVLTYLYDRELACYIMIDGVDEVENRIQSIEHCTEDVSDGDGADAAAAHKQCILYTRDSRSPVFHALQKEMWYKDWDFVWQPRHVEFLDYVLEPSLTYAFHIKSGDPVWNIPETEGDEDKKEEEKNAITLQESTYRYCSVNTRLIRKL